MEVSEEQNNHHQYTFEEIQATVQRGRDEVVRLFNEGIDVNAKYNKQHGYLNDERTILMFAVEAGDIEMIKLLVDRGADIHMKSDRGETAVLLATKKNMEQCVNLLLARGAKLDDTDEKGRNLLHLAVRAGNEALVKAFIDLGIDVCSKTESDLTPLYYAAIHDNARVFKLLLKNKAKRKSLVDALVDKCGTRENIHVEKVKLLLKYHGNLNKISKKDTWSLLKATIEEARNAKTFRVLLDHGIDVDSRSKRKYGETALETVAHIDCHYHEDTMDDYFYDNAGYASFGEEIMEQLLDHGVAVDPSNNFDGTPLQHVVLLNDDKAELLLNYNADVNLEVGDESLIDYVKERREEGGLDPTECVQRIIAHIVKRIYQGLSASEKNLNSIRSTEKYLNHQQLCEAEIEKMKQDFVENSAVRTYDVFVSKDLSQLAAYARNDNLLAVLKSKEYKLKYPIYWNILDYQLKKGEWRNLLLSKVKGFFHAVADTEENRGLAKLPLTCISQILSYLRNRDLRVLMRVCNAELDTDIYKLRYRDYRYDHYSIDSDSSNRFDAI